MMHDDDGTFECHADRVGGANIRGHVFVFGFGTGQRTVQRVQHQHAGAAFAKRRSNERDELSLVLDQIDRHRLQIKWHRLLMILQKVLPESLDARFEAGLSFERAVDNRRRLDPAAAVLPSQRDVHDQVEDPEALARLRRPPNDHQADARDQSLDQIAALRTELDVVEGNEANAPRRLRVGLCSGFVICLLGGMVCQHGIRGL